MKFIKKLSAIAIALSAVMLFAVGCGENEDGKQELDTDPSDKDFSTLRSASAQENAYDYKFNFRPEKDSAGQGYVGDTMPYYENGTYYIYYLKDRGDSFNHSVYLTTTKDFVHYEEVQEPILQAEGSGQETMIGTGSVVKVGEKYYFFYTANNGSEVWKQDHNGEVIRVAEGTSPTSFTKKEGWEIKPDAAVGKHDFRDPQAYYDEANHQIVLTITTPISGNANIVKYTLNEDLTGAAYGGSIYARDASVITGTVYNLECSDTFKVDDKWYLTFSAQDGDVWYTTADTQYGPYTATPKPLDGQLFYAAKHASDGTNTYMIGWARRSDSVSSTQDVKGWAGNLQKVVSDGKGGIRLAPVDAYTQSTKERVLVSESTVELKADDYVESFRCFERYMVTGKFRFASACDFGFAFDYNGRRESYKTITLSAEKISLDFNLGSVHITEIPVALKAGESYSFTYIQEGSVGVLYVEGQAAFTVRLYGVSGKNVMLWSKADGVTFSDLKQYTYTY